MTFRLAALITACLLTASPQAVAAAATAGEAQRLTGVFQAYLGNTAGVVTVVPTGEAYDVTIDFAPLLAKAPAGEFEAKVSPLVIKLADRGGGKWRVEQDQPFNASLKVPDAVAMTVAIADLRSTGIFDEALAGFESSTTELNGFALDQSITDASGTGRIAYAIASMRYETAMTASADGAADATYRGEFSGLTETINMPAAAGTSNVPVDLTIVAPRGGFEGSVAGLKLKPVMALTAWLIAHPSPEEILANQAELKTLLRDGLPIWNDAASSTTVQGLSVTTPMGAVGVETLGFEVEMSGVVAQGRLREKISIAGLSVPPGVVPPWAAELVPHAFTFDFNVADFDLAAPAGLILDSLDLSVDPPLKPDLEPQLLQALLPKGAVTLGLGASGLVTKVFELAVEGSMTAGPVAMPAGKATLTAKGFDRLMAALTAAPAEMGLQQAAPVLLLAKGMAKQEADGSLSWTIESTPAGGFLVNGLDPLKMAPQ